MKTRQHIHQFLSASIRMIPAAITLCCLVSCSVTRKLPAHEKLYIGADVRITDKNLKGKQEKALENELEGLIRPKPNTSILGIRYKLLFYNMVDSVPPHKRGLKYFIKNKLGEPPVLFSDVSIDANTKIVCNRLENRGFFNAKCKADIIDKKKKVKVIYRPEPGIQYFIRNVQFLIDSSNDIGAEIMKTRPSTFLKPKDAYDLNVIKAERDRIDVRLKEKGFYYFSPDDILVQVDSTAGGNQVDLYVRIKANTPYKAKQVYRIANTYIFPNFNISQDTIETQFEKYKNFYMADPEHKWKPVTFERYIYFQPGDIYNRTAHNIALNNVASIGAFKFVKNKFVETGDSNRLDVQYFLTPFPKKSIRAEITGKKTDADFTGTALTINWRNRNTFRGAELLSISLYGGTDVQSGGNQSTSNRSYYKLGSQISLSIPRFITPFSIGKIGTFLPRTRFTLGYDFLSRQNSYTLNSLRTVAGYSWKKNTRVDHELNIIDVNYVHATHVTEIYKELAASDATLRKAIEDQFTIGSSYRYINTNTANTKKIHTTYYMGGIDLSGNIPGLLTGANIQEGDQKKFFGAPFSQYVKMESDLRYYFKIGEKTRLANRLFVGAGFAYGNSTNLPFVKQFFIGGSNSIRAFRARTVGPGSYYAPDDPNAAPGFTADQSGDLKLEFSTELRQHIAGFVNGAIFFDAGNIWLLKDDINPDAVKPGSLFTKRFLDDLLVGTGVGLRFDLSFVILRTDLAFPLRKPWLPAGERWVFNDLRFGSPTWRRDNLVLHLAIGYPF
ncbi:MAG: BamA/TamA family outer membrane protein [Saprospiraceae bacterium]